MTRIISVGTGVLAVALFVSATATQLSAQTTTANKRTYLTFSGTVQVPGATLPPGTYLFQIADPDAQQIWQVFDAKGHHLLAQFFYVRARSRTIQQANAAHDKPVVRFFETPNGIPPALRVLYYPSDLSGAEFLYPKDQATQLAAVTNQPVLATDSDAKKTTLAHIMTIEPGAAQPPNTAPAVETAPLAAQANTPQKPSDDSRPVATSGADEPRPVGTSGRDETPKPASSAGTAEPSKIRELPKTSSVMPLVGWLGVLALTSGIAVRLRRGRSPF